MAAPNQLPEHYITNWTHLLTDIDRYATLHELRQNPRWQHTLLQFNEVAPTLPSPLSELDCPIHPIWRYSAWRDYEWPNDHQVVQHDYDHVNKNLSVTLYRRIEPALRLATILLHRIAPLLVRIAIQPTRQHLGYLDIDPDDNPFGGDYLFLDRFLDELALEFRICKLSPHTPADVTWITGCCDIFENQSATQDPSLSRHPVLCAYGPEKLDGVDTDAWYARSEDQKRSMLVTFANTLVHELAHAVYKKRLVKESEALPTYLQENHRWKDEPRIPPDTYAELGWSVMLFHFGCALFVETVTDNVRDPMTGTISTRVRPLLDGSGGVMALSPPPNTLDWVNAENRLISLATLKAMFDKRTWSVPTLSMHIHENDPLGAAYYRV